MWPRGWEAPACETIPEMGTWVPRAGCRWSLCHLRGCPFRGPVLSWVGRPFGRGPIGPHHPEHKVCLAVSENWGVGGYRSSLGVLVFTPSPQALSHDTIKIQKARVLGATPAHCTLGSLRDG